MIQREYVYVSLDIAFLVHSLPLKSVANVSFHLNADHEYQIMFCLDCQSLRQVQKVMLAFSYDLLYPTSACFTK